MNQQKLLSIVMGMSPGQSYQISHSDMISCANGMLRSAFDGPVRQSDIDEFIKAASENWGVRFSQNMKNGSWDMVKGQIMDWQKDLPNKTQNSLKIIVSGQELQNYFLSNDNCKRFIDKIFPDIMAMVNDFEVSFVWETITPP